MYAEYAKDPRMKLNLGIRRRLAPLLDNGRDEIELMHAILFSLPGSPVLYYGDEIGDGRQRLPRRPRRRAHADAVDGRPQRRLLARRLRAALPAAADGSRSTATRPSTSRRSCARRPRSCAGCAASSRCARSTRCSGSARTSRSRREPARSSPTSAATRTTSSSASTTSPRSAQAVELDLSRYEGMVPEEMFGRTRFPRDRRAAVPADARAARLLLVPAARSRGVIADRSQRASSTLVEERLLEFVRGQRWFGVEGAGGRARARARRRALRDERAAARRSRWSRSRFQPGTHELYQLLLGLRPADDGWTGRDRRGRRLDGLRRARRPGAARELAAR